MIPAFCFVRCNRPSFPCIAIGIGVGKIALIIHISMRIVCKMIIKTNTSYNSQRSAQDFHKGRIQWVSVPLFKQTRQRGRHLFFIKTKKWYLSLPSLPSMKGTSYRGRSTLFIISLKGIFRWGRCPSLYTTLRTQTEPCPAFLQSCSLRDGSYSVEDFVSFPDFTIHILLYIRVYTLIFVWMFHIHNKCLFAFFKIYILCLSLL